MSKNCIFTLNSVLLCAAALSLSGCVEVSSNEIMGEPAAIYVRLSQELSTVTVPEDLTFHDLLNTPNAANNENISAPEIWHEINYHDNKASMSVFVENCPTLDLLDLITYSKFDTQGRPSEYWYHPICGAESSTACGGSQIIPLDLHRKLSHPDVNNFAFSGICISADGLDAISFIAFLKKD